VLGRLLRRFSRREPLRGWWLEGEDCSSLTPQECYLKLMQIVLARLLKKKPSRELELYINLARQQMSDAREGRIPEREMLASAHNLLASELVLRKQQAIETWMGSAAGAKTFAVLSLVFAYVCRRSPVWTLAGILAFVTAVISYLCIKRHAARQGLLYPQELPLSSLRPRLLLLRSFQDDGWQYHRRGFNLMESLLDVSFEEEILRKVQADGSVVGPIVAVAQPRKGDAPTMRFVRIVLPDSEWQNSVASLIGRSRAVLLLPHFTGGLDWEVERILRPKNRSKLLILLPAKGFMDIATRWSRFICQMMHSGIPLAPEGGWDKAELREQKKLFPLDDSMILSLERIHAEHGGNADTLAFLRQCLLVRAVGCAYDSTGYPVLFTSPVSGNFGRGWWRPNPYTYGAVLKQMIEWQQDRTADQVDETGAPPYYAPYDGA
jgi:hypothetical protein